MNYRSLCLFITIALVFTGIALAQGTLIPPGEPAVTSPTMPSLNQIEPRIFIETLPGTATSQFVITQPGSYVLSGNVSGETGKNGIEVLVSHVTIDLNGFSLEGVAGSLDGIQSYVNHITVVNGSVRSWGDDGIDLANWAHIENIQAASNTGFGISVRDDSLILNCQSRQNGVSGFFAEGASVVRDCVAVSNGGDGLTYSSTGGQILNSCFQYNGTDGIGASAGGSWVIQGNSCTYNDYNGINVCYGNTILDNVCTDNGAGAGVTDGAGINLRCGANLVRGNLLVDNDIGVSAGINGDEVIIQNVAIGNSGGSYNGSTGNDIGPIGSASTATSPWANIHH